MSEIKTGAGAYFDPAKANRDAISKQNRNSLTGHDDHDDNQLSTHSDANVENALHPGDQVGDKHAAPEPFDKVLAKLIDKHIEAFNKSDAADPNAAAARQGLLGINHISANPSGGSVSSIQNARSGIKTTNEWGLGA